MQQENSQMTSTFLYVVLCLYREEGKIHHSQEQNLFKRTFQQKQFLKEKKSRVWHLLYYFILKYGWRKQMGKAHPLSLSFSFGAVVQSEAH